MSQTFSDYLYKSKFSFILVQKSSELILKKVGRKLNGENVSLSDNEKITLNIFEYFGSLQRVLEDIEKAIIFLKIDKKKIKKVFPEIKYDEDYYKYHFENYIFRIISLQDIVGKLGNLLYKTNIKDEKCNGFNFKEALEKKNKPISNLISKILKKTNEIKDVRNKKLHKGDAEISNLKGVIFWEDLERITNSKFDKILHKMTEDNLVNQIKAIEKECYEILDLIIEFFDNSIDELNEL